MRYIPGRTPRRTRPATRRGQSRFRPFRPDPPLFPGGNVRELWSLDEVTKQFSAPKVPQYEPHAPPDDPIRVVTLSERSESNGLAASKVQHEPHAPPSVLIELEGPEPSSPSPLPAPDQTGQPGTPKIRRASSAPQIEDTKEAQMSAEISVEPEASYPPQPEIDSPIQIPEDVGAGLRPAHRGNNTTPKRFRGRDKQPDSTLFRHATHCSICNHPEREAIEQSILHWYSPTVIAYEFDLADRRIVYRHAHAFGLFHRRAEQSRHALGFLIEQAQSIVPTADAIIRAVRALACIDDHGHWHEPRKEVMITHRYEDATSRPVEVEDADAPDAPEPEPKRLAVARSTRRKTPQRNRSAAAQPAEPRHKSWSPLRLFSTRLLRKDQRNSSNINKTTKTSRHTIAHFDDAENRAVAPGSRRRF